MRLGFVVGEWLRSGWWGLWEGFMGAGWGVEGTKGESGGGIEEGREGRPGKGGTGE